MEKRLTIIFYILIVVLLVINLFVKIGFYETELPPSKLKELAGELKSKGLYQQAIKVYQDYLSISKISSEEKANINFIIGEIYNENLKDFENALMYYIKAKYLHEKSPNIQVINQRIVECLENSGRSREAQLVLEETSTIGEKKLKPGDVILAKIDNNNITLSEFEDWLKNLPEELKKNYQTTEGKKQLLRQFIGEELAYRMALRKGLQNDPQLLKNIYYLKRNFMISKLLQTELKEKIKPTQNDLLVYYNANKTKYKNKPFEQIYQQVYNDYLQEKYQQQFQLLMEKMLSANKVEIFDGNLK